MNELLRLLWLSDVTKNRKNDYKHQFGDFVESAKVAEFVRRFVKFRAIGSQWLHAMYASVHLVVKLNRSALVQS